MSITILTALADDGLFGTLFADPSWARWRVFLAALFGLAMTDADLAVYTHHTGRLTAPLEAFREAALICGRRGGKSRVLALIAVFLTCFRDYSTVTAPGEVPTIAIIAADRKQARVILGYAVGLLKAVPMLAGLIEDQLTESVRLTNGVVIEVHTGAIGAPRGRTFAAVLCDEIAFWRSDDSANPDTEVLAAVRPALATIPGSMLLMASSPYAKRGALYNTFKRHYGRDGSRTLVWRGASLEMNPALDPAIVEAAREDDPASARAEYDAEFRDDIAAFVSREVVEGCISTGRHELPPRQGVHYTAFTDPSGGSSDSMTLGIAHLDREGVPVLDALREVRPPFSPEAVVVDFARILRSYGVKQVHGDRYAGEWPRERFAVHGITYHPADRPKSDLYRDLLPLLNSGNAELLDDPRLVQQLCALERRTARGGRDSIDHPPGNHDDLANAAVGALLHAKIKPPQPARTITFNYMGR
ncbi:hypothetical protein AruPA_18965 [Acidiphilium sp. PA]|uniref:hypothetical protein n=1 Tax=Acidiphilium sp. PA TaxID=2871705 RepID=UPI0022440874|nr:hypothetical protein [Acidiphilium sp. PA]MCW8309118.1 hypothetical protein [Acidiphilium sp. PA]